MPFKYASSFIAGSELAKDLSSHIAGKTILITGVSPNSLGAAYVKTVVAHSPALVIVAGRNLEKLNATVADAKTAASDANIRTLELDLASLDAVRKSAAIVNSWDDVPKIDVLVLNAAVMAHPYQKTVDGFESQFGTNHLGHFLFANLIMPKVLAAKNSRIVSVSSMGHLLSPVRWSDLDFQDGKVYNKWTAYGQAKTANILFARALAKRLGPQGVIATSLHPGGINTNLGAHLDSFEGFLELLKSQGSKMRHGNFNFLDHDKGHANHILASFSPEITQEYNGVYFDCLQPASQWEDDVFPWATDDVEAERLWKLSEDLVKQKFEY